jgi:hypothetical protein
MPHLARHVMQNRVRGQFADEGVFEGEVRQRRGVGIAACIVGS